MVDYLRQHAIQGPWETAERLLVCVGPDALAEEVVRTASRLATGLNASFVAVTVRRRGARRPTRPKRGGSRTRCGSPSGSAARPSGSSARTCRPKSCNSRGARTSPRSSSAARARASGRGYRPVAVERDRAPFRRHRRPCRGRGRGDGERGRQAGPALPSLAGLPLAALAAVVSVAVAVGARRCDQPWLHLPNLSMIFLTAVLFCAVRFGLRSAVLASILSFLAYDFFFVEPLYNSPSPSRRNSSRCSSSSSSPC